MALIKQYEKTVYGKILTFENAYFQIGYLSGDKNQINFSIKIYEDQSKTNFIEQLSFSFIPSISDSSSNFIKQGYEYLKTLTNFQGAIDVLEDGQTA